MKDLEAISKKQRIIGHCLPCAAVVLVPVVDATIFSDVALETYDLALLMPSVVWLIAISPLLLIFSVIFSRKLVKTHILYDILTVLLYSSLSVIFCYCTWDDPMKIRLHMIYICARTIFFVLTFAVMRVIKRNKAPRKEDL